MTPRTAILLSVLAAALNVSTGHAEEPAVQSRITGNGALTVNVDARGQIARCAWPTPSHVDQIDGVPPRRGPQWAVRIGDETIWLSDPALDAAQDYTGQRSVVVRTTVSPPDAAWAATVRTFVHPERDILISRLTIHGLATAPHLYWFAGFSPATRVIPEWPGLRRVLQAGAGFAAFTPDEGKSVYHFRPNQPGAVDWRRAEELALEGGALGEWAAIGEGAWMAYTSPNYPVAFQCGSGADGAFEQVSQAQLAGSASAVAPCDSAVLLAPERVGDAFCATVFVGFGKNAKTCRDHLDFALTRGYEGLRNDTDSHWESWLARSTPPATDDASVSALCERALLTMAQCTDRATGATIRAASADPALALDWARDCAWIAGAWDLAGYTEWAERYTRFQCGAVRTTARPGMPLGSIPAASYTDHTPGIPHVVLDTEATAWLLAAVDRHVQNLSSRARADYVEEVWDAVAASASFLAEWTDGRSRRPLQSYDFSLRRDSRPARLLLTHYMGLDSAIRIARAGKRQAPEVWTRRKRELDVLIRFQFVGAELTWRGGEILPFVHTTMAEEWKRPALPSWDAPIEDRLAIVGDASPAEYAQTLCDAALVWEDEPERLQALRPVLGEVPVSPAPDALTSALHLIAAHRIYAPAR
ncbi:MAG: hypothetical protein GWP08_02320 [Nitrospiraceae bacterium]|nr:hypothetical protein [Nitrospiraceae bacterium]